MKLSIIVPAYNEEKTIGKIIEELKSIEFGVEKEIIIVDDGSTDNTSSILKELQNKFKEIKVIFHKKNQGKGAAIRTGIKISTGDIIAIQDADTEYNPHQIKDLIQPILKNDCLIVYGSRFLKENPVLYKKYYFGNKFISWVIRKLFGGNVTDAYTCYKIFHRKTLENITLESKGFEIEAELTCKFLKNKYRILELPISYTPRSLKEGKKIKFKDAIIGLLTILKIKFFKY